MTGSSVTEHSRRHFLAATAAALATGAASPLRAANDKVNLAIIGLGGRGRDHINEYSKLPDARKQSFGGVILEAVGQELTDSRRIRARVEVF